jgi:hypothetical protein
MGAHGDSTSGGSGPQVQFREMQQLMDNLQALTGGSPVGRSMTQIPATVTNLQSRTARGGISRMTASLSGSIGQQDTSATSQQGTTGAVLQEVYNDLEA